MHRGQNPESTVNVCNVKALSQHEKQRSHYDQHTINTKRYQKLFV